jgi:hypothetical protein
MTPPLLMIAIGVVACFGWYIRWALLRSLKNEHAATFRDNLASATLRQLMSRTLSAAELEAKSRFRQFIWRLEFLKLGDPDVSLLGYLIIASDIALVVLLIGLVASIVRA